MIDFSDEAHVVLPLCDLLDPNLSMPTLVVRGGASYSAAFETLRQEIEANLAQLKADSYLVHRPFVWFVSDGEPSDSEPRWRAAFAELTSSRMAPYFVPCAIDWADPQTMISLIHPTSGPRRMASYIMEPNFDPAQAIRAIGEIIIATVILSAYGLASGQTGLTLPPRSTLPAGIRQYDPDSRT